GQHEEIQRLRRNLYDLVDYLQREEIAHFLAHPLYNANPLFSLGHVEKLLLLFPVIEVRNGGKGSRYNALTRTLVKRMTPEEIARLADKHGLEPVGKEPWNKGWVGGSDDHGGLFIAGTHTAVEGAPTVNDFLRGIASRRGQPDGRDGGALTLAHNIYSVAYRFYRARLIPKGSASRDVFTIALDSLFRGEAEARRLSFLQRIQILADRCLRYLPGRRSRDGETSLFDLLRRESRDLLRRDGELRTLLFESQGHPDDLNRAIFRFAGHLYNTLLFHYTRAFLSHATRINLLEAFETISAFGSLHLLLSPYFFSFEHQNKDRQLLAAVRNYCGIDHGNFQVAYLTEGAAWSEGRRLHFQRLCEEARSREGELTVLTCAPEGKSFHEGVKTLPTVGVFDLWGLPHFPLYFPPLLELLEYCDRYGFNVIHTDTPGPMGLAALAVGKFLHCPVIIQHDAALVEDFSRNCPPESVPLFWKYLRWVYEAMDMILVQDAAERESLIEQGITAGKIRIVHAGELPSEKTRWSGLCRVYGEALACP
ncbi:MAG: glycosyltransferase, partial [Nitrospirae bacterium]|nr:glycosyltransferase [Nitrospirota bacterium]